MSKQEILGFTRHPVSAVWPDLDATEFTTLVNGIDEQGLHEPILVTPDNQVVDGWHRLRACADLGHRPGTVTTHASLEELAKRVIGAHQGRRHLSKTEMGEYVVKTMRVGGMRFAEPGERIDLRQDGEGSESDNLDQDDPGSEPKSAPSDSGVITSRTVAEKSGISEPTAKRALANVRREEEGEHQGRDDLRTNLPPHLKEQEAIKRKADRQAKRSSRVTPLDEQLSFWKETAESVAAELAEARAHLASVAADLDDEITGDDALSEAKRAMQEIRKHNERLQAENNSLRERLAQAESQAEYGRVYGSKLEEALQRRGDT